MNADRSCLSCEKPLKSTMNFPVRGVKNVYFCGDHFQLGATYFCTPCAGQLRGIGVDKNTGDKPASN